MSKSNYIKNKDETVVVALDYGMSWDYEDAIKEFPRRLLCHPLRTQKCKPWRFRRAVQFYYRQRTRHPR